MRIKLLKRIAAYSLIEMMFAATIFTVVGGAVGTAYMFSLRSFQALSNYSKLDEENREAVDRISRELREATTIQTPPDGYQKSQLVFLDCNGKRITYSFNRYSQTLTRTSNSVVTVLLTNCSLINFNLGTRAVANNYMYYTNSDPNHAKIVDLTWKTSKTVGGRTFINSENIQTARIVIRKQALQQ